MKFRLLKSSQIIGIGCTMLGLSGISQIYANGVDELKLPMASTNNLFFENGTDTIGAPPRGSVNANPGIVRSEIIYPSDEETERVAFGLPIRPVDDLKAYKTATKVISRSENANISAVHIKSKLSPGDYALILNGDRGNSPVAKIEAEFDGWISIPLTTKIVMQLQTNGDGIFAGGVDIDGLGVAREQDLRLSSEGDSDQVVLTGSTDGMALGMTGAFAVGSGWLKPSSFADPKIDISSQEETELRFLEDKLFTLTQNGRSGDPIIQEKRDAWVFADSKFKQGGSPGVEYQQTLQEPASSERSINALLSEIGRLESGGFRRIVISQSTMEPAEFNLTTHPQLVAAMRINNSEWTTVQPQTIEGLISSVENAAGIGESRAEDALKYVRLTLGSEIQPDRSALDRLHSFSHIQTYTRRRFFYCQPGK